MPTACHSWAETVAASRCLHTPDLGGQAIVSGHTHATRARRRAQEVVFLVPDTPCLHYGTTRPKAGMGTGNINTRDEALLPLTAALTPARVH